MTRSERVGRWNDAVPGLDPHLDVQSWLRTDREPICEIGARRFWVGSFQHGDDRSGIISARMRSTDGASGAERRPYREAAHYYKARPPYSAALRPALAEKLGWTGAGRLLDIGCGPGIVALELAPSFSQVIGLDPEETMLAEARVAAPSWTENLTWVLGRAEDIPALNLGRFQAVTLAQSFHWTDKDAVAEIVYDSLESGGSMLLIHHVDPSVGPAEASSIGTGDQAVSPRHLHPQIPHEVIDEVLVRWLGRGKPARDPNREPYHDLLARTRFGEPERLVLPGRTDLIRTVDEVIDNYLSTSFAAPDLFGDQLPEFRRDLTAILQKQTDTGRFWEWAGDTEVLIATKRVG